jgi:hypothetical protein
VQTTENAFAPADAATVCRIARSRRRTVSEVGAGTPAYGWADGGT